MFRRYFITGLLIWVPIGITLWVLDLVVTTMDLSLSLLPANWQPVALFGRHLPGLGALLTILVIFVTGVLTTNFLGQKLVTLWEGLLARIPIVRTIYSSVKQVSDTLLSPQGNAFRKALLVEYPRKGSWTIGFMTGTPADEVRRRVMQAQPAGEDAGSGAEMVSIYVPTTPNPTSGFFLMMRREDCIELDMSVDEALKYIVSMGVVAPATKARGSARGPNTKINAEIS
ncbi:MAG: hypothetical protein RJA99_3624 [Pseudomonadota bacterium]|jgi:uncharacterized membrane protein